MASHSIISPSSASVWSKCTAYPTFSQPYQDNEDTEASREGTAAHELGEALIRLALAMPDPILPSIRDTFVGQLSPNGEVWTDEMFDGAWLYAGEIVREHKRYPGSLYGLEGKVQSPSIHAESFGTIDHYMYVESIHTVKIWDFKFGYRAVEAENNMQMINYFAGILDTHNITDDCKVEMTIVQPRAYHRDGPIRTWKTTGAELRAKVNMLHNKAQEALSGDTNCLTGSHCRYCEARHDCEAALNCGMDLYEVASKPIRTVMSFDDMGVQLDIIDRAIEQLGFLKTAYEQRITNELKQGGHVDGWSLSPKYGNLEWNVDLDQVLNLGKMMGVELEKPKAVITPRQAMDKGLDKDAVMALASRKKGTVKLTRKGDTVASKIFGKKGN